MSTAIWLISYTLFNILLGIHNKWVLSVSGFSFPWLLTSIHILISGIGSLMLIKIGKICKPAALRREGYYVLAAFSILNALNIAMSNISLNYVSLAIHQMIRSLFPMLNMILDYLLLGRKHHYSLVLAVIPTIVGVSLASLSEYKESNVSKFGVAICAIGAVLASIKALATNVIMVGEMKLHPVDFLCKMTLFAFPICMFFAAVADEYDEVKHIYLPKSYSEITVLAIELLCNGLIAFFLNWTSFSANKLTSPVTMAVVGNVKQAVTIGLSMMIFGQKKTLMNTVGTLLAIAGGILYTYLSIVFNNRTKQQQRINDMTSIEANESELVAPLNGKNSADSILEMKKKLAFAS